MCLTNTLRYIYHMNDNDEFHFYNVPLGGHTNLKGTARNSFALYKMWLILSMTLQNPKTYSIHMGRPRYGCVWLRFEMPPFPDEPEFYILLLWSVRFPFNSEIVGVRGKNVKCRFDTGSRPKTLRQYCVHYLDGVIDCEFPFQIAFSVLLMCHTSTAEQTKGNAYS